MTLKELTLSEEKESELLRESAVKQAILSTNALSVRIVSSAIKKALNEQGQVDRYDTLAHDNDLLQAADEMRAEAAKIAHDNFFKAIKQGFLTDIKGRAELQNKAPGHLELDADFEDSELDYLEGYPVLGHTILDIAMYLANTLSYQIHSIISGPLRGEFTVDELPARLDQQRQKFANDVGNSVINAYISGTQAAQELVRSAINAASR